MSNNTTDDGGAADRAGVARTGTGPAPVPGSTGLRLAGDRVVLHLELHRSAGEPGVHSAVPLDAADAVHHPGCLLYTSDAADE